MEHNNEPNTGGTTETGETTGGTTEEITSTETQTEIDNSLEKQISPEALVEKHFDAVLKDFLKTTGKENPGQTTQKDAQLICGLIISRESHRHNNTINLPDSSTLEKFVDDKIKQAYITHFHNEDIRTINNGKAAQEWAKEKYDKNKDLAKWAKNRDEGTIDNLTDLAIIQISACKDYETDIRANDFLLIKVVLKRTILKIINEREINKRLQELSRNQI